MNYQELSFVISSAEDFHQDLIINVLAEIGFDTFEETEGGFNAYIKEEAFNEHSLKEALATLPGDITYSFEMHFVPQQNWNEVWESNFSPIAIGKAVYIRATFHEQAEGFKHEIVIDPKMSFGTGHHQTTALMMEWILEGDMNEKSVLDMGCGTAILGILAAKTGAKAIDAIDYDPVCYESAVENAQLNKIDNLTAFCGSKEAIPAKQYDVILANINRNILLDQLDRYAEVLKDGGELYLSGFYEKDDLQILKDEAKKHQLSYTAHKKMDEWVAAKFRKL